MQLIQSQLGSDGSADEKLLHQLDTVVRYVSPVAAHHGSSLAQLMAALQADALLMQEVMRKGDSRFLEIKQVQTHMARLELWLTKGLGGLEAVFVRHGTVKPDPPLVPLKTHRFSPCAHRIAVSVPGGARAGQLRAQFSCKVAMHFISRRARQLQAEAFRRHSG